MDKILKILIAIAVIIMIPLYLFFVADKKTDGGLHMPKYYRIKNIVSSNTDGTGGEDTLYHQVGDITLVNQLGDTVSLNKDLKGKVLIMNFIFTNCPSICPPMSENMAKLQKSFKKKNPELFQFISISIDPERDSVAALRQYANSYTTDHDLWWFLTGSKSAIHKYMRDELDLLLNADDTNFIDHTPKMVLVDSMRFIRGYYDALKPEELKKCADDAIFVSIEKRKKKRS